MVFRVGSVLVLATWAPAGVALPCRADTVVFDFTQGIGPNFTLLQQRPFWSIMTDGTGLRISKPADDGSSFSVPDSRSDAGLIGSFTFEGDFAVALPFAWNLTATPTFSAGANAASLVVISATHAGFHVAVSSVSLWNGTQRIDVNYSAPLAALPAGTAFPTPLSAVLGLARVGSTLTMSWSGNVLNSLSLPPEFLGAVYLFIDVHQGQNHGIPQFTGIAPREAMDVSFRSLAITAGRFGGLQPVPEPGTLGLIAMLVICGALAHSHSRKRLVGRDSPP